MVSSFQDFHWTKANVEEESSGLEAGTVYDLIHHYDAVA